MIVQPILLRVLDDQFTSLVHDGFAINAITGDFIDSAQQLVLVECGELLYLRQSKQYAFG